MGSANIDLPVVLDSHASHLTMSSLDSPVGSISTCMPAQRPAGTGEAACA